MFHRHLTICTSSCDTCSTASLSALFISIICKTVKSPSSQILSVLIFVDFTSRFKHISHQNKNCTVGGVWPLWEAGAPGPCLASSGSLLLDTNLRCVACLLSEKKLENGNVRIFQDFPGFSRMILHTGVNKGSFSISWISSRPSMQLIIPRARGGNADR